MKNNIIEKIKEKLDIVDYIGKYLTLSKKGNAHVAVCPFHEDTNPSLSINTSKQIFKCFPCGAGGDIIEFASLYNKVDFKTALGLLAKEANIDYNSNFQNNKAYVSSGDKKLLTINKLANDYFKLNLLVTNNDLSNKANDYLKNTRKIPDSIIKKFEIGVAFKNDKNFLNYLDVKKQEHEFTDLDLRKSNIIIEKNNSKYSFFSDRIIFPIKNEDKKIVAFSSRKFLPNDESAKYINSKETDVFKKDEILYNLDNAMVKIKLKDFIIICEGFMDVIALETVGIENSVAIMGTALTLKHISKISKLTKNVVLFYDNDDAGFLAAKNAAVILAKNNLNVSLIINDVEKDPDEVLQKHGKKALIDITNRKFSFLNFIIFKYSENNKFLQNKSTEVSNLVFEYLVNLQDEIEIESTIIELSSKINIDKKIIKNSYEIFKKNYSQKKKPKTLTFERLNSTSHDFFTQDTISYNHNFDEPKFLDNDVETIDAHLDDKFLDDFVSEMTNSSVNSSNNFFTEEFEKENPKIVKNYQSSLEESYLSIWKRHNRSKENIKNIEYLILKHMIMNKEDFEGYKKHIGSFINHNARDWARIIEQFYQENPGINLSFETILDEKSIKHYNISNNLLVDLKHIKNVISPTSEIKLKAWKDYGQKLSCHKHEIDLIEKYKKIKKGDKSLKILKEIGIMIINLNNRRMN